MFKVKEGKTESVNHPSFELLFAKKIIVCEFERGPEKR